MGKVWKKRKKYKPNTEKIENSHKRIRFNLTKFARREAMFVVLSIIAVTIVTISSAYAVFSSIQKADEYNTIKVGTLEIEFKDTEDGMGNIINLNGAYPESDSKGQQRDPYTFKVTNKGSLSAKYVVKLLDDEEMIAEDGCQDKLLPKDKIKYSLNGGEARLLSEAGNYNFEIYEGLLDKNASKTHSIRIWISDAAGNEVLGSHYHGKIVISAVNHEADTLMATTGFSDTRVFYAYRNSITSLTFHNSINVPTDGSVVEQWDISEAQDGSVIGYIVNDGSGNNTYSLFIEANGPIYANSNSSNYFSSFKKLQSIYNIQYLNTTKTTNMEYMFESCEKLVQLDLSNFDTSNVTTMRAMFHTCKSLQSLDMSKFNTSSVTDMTAMFYNCQSLSIINVNHFDVSKVIKLNNVFGGTAITTIDLSNWNTSNVTEILGLFEECKSLTHLDLSNFNTSKVENMQGTFNNCESLTTLNISTWDTSNVVQMINMFRYTRSLQELDLRSFDTSNVMDMRSMFYFASSLTSIKVTTGKWDMTNATTASMLYGAGVSDFTYH